MNQGTTKEFVFRRLTEPISVFGYNLNPKLWLFVLGVVLFVGLIYVAIMYIRDSRGVGPFWASLLGLLRLSVYFIIGFIFLLPSRESWEVSSASSRVAVMIDTSGSQLTTRDDLPANGVAFDKMPTRTDKMLAFFNDSQINFFPRLMDKNPVVLNRFAVTLDSDFYYLDTDGRTYSKKEFAKLEEERRQPNYQKDLSATKRPLPESLMRLFAYPSLDANAKFNLPEDIGDDDKTRFEEQFKRNQALAQRKFFSATNLGESTLSLLRREQNNMLQGLVIFTDGHSTEGSAESFRQIEEVCKASNIPIFVVGIGEMRPQVRIEITDLRAPQQVQPEDKFRVAFEFTGEGLAEKEVAPRLRLTYTRKTPDGKEEQLPIAVVEQEDKKNPMKPRERVELGKEIFLQPETPAKFDNSNPPRCELEYLVDAAALARCANPVVELDKDKKWEIAETTDGAEFRLQGFVPKDKLEIFPDPEHKSDIVDLRVLKKPLRVLLFASAATHDFQFLNNMILREVDQHRAELAVFVQPPPNKDPDEWIKKIVLGVSPERLLTHFPDRYDQAGEEGSSAIYDLNQYDAIVAFDADWTRLSEDQFKALKVWSDKGGGLVVVGGPINTLQLARPGPNRDKLKPILDLMPVILKDVRIDALDRDAKDPWPLSWGTVTPEMEFLKLTEDEDKGGDFNPSKYGWDEFFYGKDPKGPRVVKRGFYNYYPTETVRTGSIVVARFDDPRAKMKDGSPMPYIVISPAVSANRVVWLAWGDTRRLRQLNESFYERFWVKLLRYAGARNQTSIAKRIRLNMGRSYAANKYINFDVKIDGKDGQPLQIKKGTDGPKVTLKLPAGVDEKEIPTTIPLVPRKPVDDSDKGKFDGRFLVKSPGDYRLEIEVPETKDKYIQKFNVKESNPELDDTRPDFEAMYNLASEAGEVLARIPSESDRQEVSRRLKPPPLPAAGGKNDAAKEKDGKPRLYFSLQDAEWIPVCMKTVTNTKRVRGPYEDEWDDWTKTDLWQSWGFPASWKWVLNGLMLIVGLLSTEWLIRKLLRLA